MPSQERRLAEDAYCWSLARLVFIGARALLNLRGLGEDDVNFAAWRDLVLREAPELESGSWSDWYQPTLFDSSAGRRWAYDLPCLVREHNAWLINTLDRDPFLCYLWGPSRSLPIEVLPARSKFYFDLKDCEPFAIFALIDKPLQMVIGRRGRLECWPVRTRLVSRPRSQAPVKPETEAQGFDLSPDRVTVCDGRVIVEVASLNEAYSRASIRYERHRRSHTGNVFEKVFWLPPGKPPPGLVVENHQGNEFIRLKYIRNAVEFGDWPLARPVPRS